ncbi:hypothetical protein Vadar_008082 [Vaccinium darrowii]|uniref:Uncharacterized protein n=1 Tax=Vaccinium darrowii TaxID=229202 RepID=A0ACB7XQ67_9ERIC|nr:hypothetical protein Vadar_008082 [Vaccinium darrowii]
MSSRNRKRRAETQLIRNDEPDDTHQVEIEEEGDRQLSGEYSVPEIPTHIIYDILSRLPIKTLFNCRRVCKEWLSLISDPRFAKLHLSRSQVSLLIKPNTRNCKSGVLSLVDFRISPSTFPHNAVMKLVPEINLPKIASNHSLPLLNSCNGLLCLCEPDTRDPIYVCNPILGEFITLPECSEMKMCLSYTSAFGFSPNTNQYKVLRFFYSWVINPQNGKVELRNYPEGEIYTLGEGSWRSIGTIPSNFENFSFNSFLNGAIHWLDFGSGCPDLINCFDFGSEQFRGVPEPSGLSSVKIFWTHMKVGVLQGCLSLCDYFDSEHAAIWVMKDYGVKESWSKDFVIPNISIASKSFVDYYEPITVFEDGKILIFFSRDALFLYDPKSQHYEDVQILGIPSWFHVIAHISSLVSLRDVAKGQTVKMCRS